ncbi:MAG TPA: protease pro-enzyme activation domain-containing protein [Candidatus Baltobacteraceae bacterium]|jgi:hypothetical protein|nr:protease pro-enzyme activation domain-containing protein [Candidatus Baltobacteraceae bacterium]
MLLALASTAGLVQPTRTLPGHVPDVVAGLRPVSDLPAQTTMRLAIGLPLRNKAALTNLIDDLYNPASPRFHRYLTTGEFTGQFGPSIEDYQKVAAFLRSHGLKVTDTHPNRVVLDVSGAAADVEKTFHIHLRVYRHPTEQRNFFAPDTEPSVEADVPLLDVMGLDNYIIPHPLDLQRRATNEPVAASVTNYAEIGSGPNGLFIGRDFRTAYVPGVTNTGTGQYIGLVEFGPYWTNDIHTYEITAGLSTNIVISNIFLDGVTEPPAANTDAGEEAIDMEMCISMAPGATVLYYGGEVVNDIYSRIASDNLAKQISCSFGFGIDSTTEQLYQEFVVQGQNFFVTSGDGGAYVGTINPPAAEPYITVVGGTRLFTDTPGGPWQQELTWLGSGGGVSTFYAIPNYQQGINMAPLEGSGTMRNFPDVAMMADTVIFIAANNTTGSVGGTSCSSPQWAGFYALANQQASILGEPPLGFFNPALYALGKSAKYTQCFHDITSGNTTNYSSGPKKFFAATGYDLCTGWGSPTGSNLINALTEIGTNNFMLYATPVALNLTAGGSGAALVTVQPMNHFTGDVALSLTNLPAGVTASFDPGVTTGTSVLTLAADSAASAGTSTLTLAGASGSITQAVALTLTVVGATPGTAQANLSAIFNLAVIYRDGSTFSASGGADGGGNAYSATLLGSALNWDGCFFKPGVANASDVIKCSGQTVPLPSGKYSSLQMLATGVDGAQTSQQFIVKYTDGTTSIFTQSLSDWTAPQDFPGEAVVVATPYRNTDGGTKDTVTQAVIYGYSFGLNNTKTVQSIKLPDNGDVLVFAITLANDFTLYGAGSSLVLTAGGKATSYIVSAPVDGFSGGVSLSAGGLPPGVTASFDPSSSTNSSILTLTASATAQPVSTNVELTGTLGELTHNMDFNLSVISPIPGAATVSLGSAYNVAGIANDGASFNTNGGLDGNGNAFSAELLGSAPNWNGVLFGLGPTGALDAVQCAGQTVALPGGQYTGLLLLAAAVNTSQPDQTFQINYTDGSSVTVTQSFSLWTAPQDYVGESVAVSTAYADTSGGTNNTAAPVNLYGYVLGLNDSKTVQSITLPNNPDLIILAMSLANTPTAVSLASDFNRTGIYTDGTSYSGGLDGGGYAYSASQLGSSQIWDSVQFNFGSANINDAVSCDGQTIALPANRYTTLLMLATGVDGNRTSQSFTVTYTDGTTATFVQSLSDWVDETPYPNQSIAVTMPYRLFDGNVNSSTSYLFGYLFPLNNTKTVQSLKLPATSDVEVLAVSLANTPLPVSLQSNYNRAGIYTDGTSFGSAAGMDDDGNALSATLLGPSEVWRNTLFEYGVPNATNVVSATGQTITLPQGQYSALLMLALAVNGSQSSQLFTVSYTNGAVSSVDISLSDWVEFVNYTGQSTVVTMGYRDSSSGGKSSPGYLYGYSIPLNSSYVVRSLKLPDNANVEVVAISLSNYTAALPEAPVIAIQPESLTVTNGDPAVFAVTATGSPPLLYQWQKNGVGLTNGGNIAGSSSAALTLSTTGANDAGSYDVIVTNSYGSVTSSVVALNVVFTFQTVAQTAGQNGSAIAFSWLTTPGVSYQVQYTTNLDSTNWTDLGSATIATNGVTTNFDTLGPDPQRFYRIIQQ